jgi:acyl-CoA hydrolase
LIVLHSACAQPQRLAALLALHAPDLDGATIVTLMPMADSPYASPEALAHLHVQTFFPGKGLRTAAKEGTVDVKRVPLSRICSLFDAGVLKADLLLLRLSPDKHGSGFSLGVSVDYMQSVLAQRPVVVAEIDESMPWTFGATAVSASAVDYVLAAESPVTEMPASAESEVDGRIADHVAELIPQRAMLQTGIGVIPDLVLARLGHLNGLGLHTGTVTDAVLPLFTGGNITNAGNTLNLGKSITTMATGTQALYQFLHRNPSFEFHPCRITHDPALLATLPKLHAINTALRADLTGAVDGERAGGLTIAGPGGLPDFCEGAHVSSGGASIVTLRSTSRDGKTSNIVLGLDSRFPPTVAGEHIDYIVTEIGVARLEGLGPAERMRAIANVAHPAFRRDLLEGV